MRASPAAYPPHRWRHRYARPGAANYIGTAGVNFLRGGCNAKAQERAREKLRQRRAEQEEQQRRQGYVGDAELAHWVRAWMRKYYAGSRFAPGIAEYAAQLCAVGRQWNFQGNWRLAELIGYCLRTAQRYRARLEEDGFLVSQCLEPGDLLPGMRAPTTHPQIVRDVSRLRQRCGRPLPDAKPLAADPDAYSADDIDDEPSSARPSAADVPATCPDEFSPEELQAIIDLTPIDMPHRAILIERRERALERANRRLPVWAPVNAVIVDDDEIDRWERDTESLDRWVERERKERERAPPD